MAQVVAKAYDNPIPGYGTSTVGNLRLWEALPVTELDLDKFNEGKFAEVGSSLCRRSMGNEQVSVSIGVMSCIVG